MKAFYQGSVDTFCGAYAVFNALQITHGIRATDARGILAKLLLSLAKDPVVFTKILTLKTNYIAMVDALLESVAKEYPIKIVQPFQENIQDKEAVWKILNDFINPDEKRTCVFQFEKRLPLAENPLFAHWTTGWSMYLDEIHLFDCSPELQAVNVLYKTSTHLQPIYEGQGEYICLNAKTIRLIEGI